MCFSNGSTMNESTLERSQHRRWRCSGPGPCGKGKWTPINIAAMVLGFVVFWPIGLVLLFWILSGRDVQELPGAIRQKWSQYATGGSSHANGESDNAVFNDYQQTQYDRIAEIKQEIKDRARRFREFRADAKRRADEDEFKQFMDRKPDSDDQQES